LLEPFDWILVDDLLGSAGTNTGSAVMKFVPKLFENNRAWAEKNKREDPHYFERLSRTQTPGLLRDLHLN
jgi:hypothetical protein